MSCSAIMQKNNKYLFIPLSCFRVWFSYCCIELYINNSKTLSLYSVLKETLSEQHEYCLHTDQTFTTKKQFHMFLYKLRISKYSLLLIWYKMYISLM